MHIVTRSTRRAFLLRYYSTFSTFRPWFHCMIATGGEASSPLGASFLNGGGSGDTRAVRRSTRRALSLHHYVDLYSMVQFLFSFS